MKATAIYKKLIISSVLTGSFLVFGGVYQGLKITDNSFMNNKEISFEKRIDENADRIVASNRAAKIAVQYLPVAQFEDDINGKWMITRIEDHLGNEVETNSSTVVDMELIGTGLVKLNDNAEYTFDVSFLHENKKTITIFRSYEEGFEVIEARRVKEDTKQVVTKAVEVQSQVEEVEEEVDASESREFVIERAVLPQLSNKMIRGDQFIEGSVTVGANGVEGLYFNVVDGDKEFNEVIGDLELKDGNSFEVELQGVRSNGIFTRNGNNGYRLRFATGPYKGALFNYVTSGELERINTEIEDMERAKEESQFERELTQEGSVEQDINLAQKQVVSANFNAPKVSNGDFSQREEEYEEEYEEEFEEEYQDDEEIERQGFKF